MLKELLLVEEKEWFEIMLGDIGREFESSMRDALEQESLVSEFGFEVRFAGFLILVRLVDEPPL